MTGITATGVELGRLEVEPLRAAWNHEAHSFTPWMAEHLDLLSAEIGVPLELEGREVAVESFSADILARNVDDGSLVLIENQLETTDHSHLGQLLTYLAGLNAQIIVWIAAEFRAPHLSAINWLNEHTVDPFAFFAVKLKLVRIGNSPMAPVFEVVARPNAWDRKLQAAAQERGEMSALGEYRKAFWAHMAERHPDQAPDTVGFAGVSFWRTLEMLDLVIVMFISWRRVGLFIRSPRSQDGEAFQAHLAPYAPELEQRLDASPEPIDGARFFRKQLLLDGTDRANWDRMVDWLAEQAALYRQVIPQVMGAAA